MNDSEENEMEPQAWHAEDMPQRTASAPPILQEKNIFAFNSFAPFFQTESNDYPFHNAGLYSHFYSPSSRLVPEIKRHPYESSTFDHHSHVADTISQEYSPIESPPMIRRVGLPRTAEDMNNETDNWPNRYWNHRQFPRKFPSSSLDDFAFDETHLVPDLSSDSESVSSSIDDLSNLLAHSVGLNHATLNDLDHFKNSDVQTIDRRRVGSAPVTKRQLENPTFALEQSLASSDPLQSTVRTNDSVRTTIPCRYYSQGYCSRGTRCSFAHVESGLQDEANVKEQNEPLWETVPMPAIKRSPTPVTMTNDGLTASNAGHKRSASSGFPSRVAVVPNFVFGTNPLSTEAGRYTSIDQVIGQIYPMCKDQHGCRFLQKKLEEQNVQVVDIIFNEVYPHFAELMTDPFGNYLCQKLLEHCQEEQRLLLIESVAADLVHISQDMHGTRAVQTMIECLRNGQEIKLVTNGLRSSVVALIKDLNGNHVIQRCLNHLTSQDNQFIYDAVAGHCVEVATHRHGCCVLQRCIDHAVEKQKLQLITEIAANALALVKDPYGNYVVQYVLDLPYAGVISILISKLKGHLVELSTQKFSSNVVEKCLTVGSATTRSWMVAELLASGQLDALIQDPFGNYVVQTAMNISDPQQHAQLVEFIKPYLPTLRNTPYGKRIQNKIMKNGSKRRQK
eukprot:TRINITY_DN703_c0_g2_i1.p1 TRINITY_DN703_c0_g2~~TRINITY_DN703_c0_g2_i1.p1  ORF type:complete len:676 (+),score=113.15 TRINITY_DN703_c0_g2_i1:55-2082(+)